MPTDDRIPGAPTELINGYPREGPARDGRPWPTIYQEPSALERLAKAILAGRLHVRIERGGTFGDEDPTCYHFFVDND